MFLFTKDVIGRYFKDYKVLADTQIAIPIFVVEGESNIKMDKSNLNKGYDFKIKNYEEEKINDVDFKYTIYFESDIQDKINLNLQKDGTDMRIINNQTEEMIMKSGEKINHLYHLEIETKEESNEIIGNVTIKVLAEQMN